jgi:hypothetical protein
MPTRAEALNNVRVLFEWPGRQVSAMRKGPFHGGTAPTSIREWVRLFGEREWLYVAGFADIVHRIPTYKAARITFPDPNRFLDHVKSQKTYINAEVIPASWREFGYTNDLSRAQIGKANRAGYVQMRFDKLCLALFCLDRAVREVDPDLDIFEIVSICPVTYYIDCDHAAQHFLRSGAGLNFDQLVSKFVRHDPVSGIAPPIAMTAIPADERETAKGILWSASNWSLMTFRTAELIADFVNSRSIGKVEIGSLSEQKNGLAIVHGEPILPRNGVGALLHAKFVRAG